MLYRIKIDICIIAFFINTSCHNNAEPSTEYDTTSKEYILNEFGQIIETEIVTSDFEPALNCLGCHPNHYEEWSESMHAHAMKDPIFFSGWNDAKSDFPHTGERFCIQCHSPSAFVTGEDLSDYSSSEALIEANIHESITAGISCDICHSMTALSQTVHTGDDIAAVAEYHLNPGEGIKYGSVKNPEQNTYHESAYNPIFKRSELCLPCHNLTIRDVEAEITFTEWNRIPGLAMSGAMPCQECHMPDKGDGTHDHRFVGVDIDLSYPIGESPLHSAVEEMLKSAVELKFGYYNQVLPDSISQGETLTIPVSISSLTAHSLPSGTSFSREAWLEIIIKDDDDTVLYESGVVENMESLDSTDTNLLLFTTTLLNESNLPTSSITHAYDIANNSLPAFSDRFYSYEYSQINNTNTFLIIDVRMLFRSFKPHLLLDHSDLLENLPIFEMASIRDTVYIQP